MKLGIVLVLIGLLLVVDGSIRIVEGVMLQNMTLSVAGIATGWLLGGWLAYRGIKRFKRKEA